MGWVSRLFDARDTLVRLLLLDLSGVGYLLFGTHAGAPPTAEQWLFAVCAFTAAPLLHRWPVGNLLAQAALLSVAVWRIDDTTINQVGTGWALLEVAMWASRARTVWLCAGLAAAVDLSAALGDPPGRLVSAVFGLTVSVGVPLLLGLVIRTTRELGRQEARRAAEQQRRRESEGRAARAQERAAIARELHDVVAHHVASMVLRVGVARHVLPGVDPRVAEVFDDVHGTGTAALADLRRLVAVLRDPDGVGGDAALTAIEPGALPEALRAAAATAGRAGVAVDVDADPAVGRLDAVRGLAVLRLTQEALTNVAKHAGTGVRARLRVAVRGGDVVWEVSDDGGAAPAAAPAPPGGGHGLTGMRERVAVLGGRLEAGPAGPGWRVATVLPGVLPPPGGPPADPVPSAADPVPSAADAARPSPDPAPSASAGPG